MRLPRAMHNELDEHTKLYIDCFVALDCLHITYPEYIQSTTSDERTLYQLYFNMKALKEQHALDRAREEAERQRAAETQHSYRD